MKKTFKRFVATLLAVAALSAVPVNASAETHSNETDLVCTNTYAFPHDHVYGGTKQRVINSISAGTHSHPTEYDANGKVIGWTTCYMRVDTYEIYKICSLCSQAYDSYTTNATIHSVNT